MVVLIRQVHIESPLTVAHMSEKEWYQLLLEDNYTMEEVDDAARSFIKCRVGRVNPETDWKRSCGT